MLHSIAPSRPSGEPLACGPRRFAGRRSRTALLAAAVAALLSLGGQIALAPGDASAQTQQPTQPPAPQQPIQVQPGQQQTPPQTQPAPTSPEAAGQRHGDWVERCTPSPPPGASPPPAGEQNVCFLIQQVMDQNRQQPLLKVTIGFFGAQRQPRAIIAMPLGVPLARGVQISVDGNQVGAIPFDVCRRDGCLANLLLDDGVIGAFKAGSQAQARVESGEGEGVNVPISLQGFTAGFGAIQ